MNKIAQNIISKFGGQVALAKLMGKTQSTISYWATSGIPAKWHSVLIKLAKANDIYLSPEDFIPIETTTTTAIEDPKSYIPRATHCGTVDIGKASLAAYVLDNGQRVFNCKSLAENLFDTTSFDIHSYIGVQNLKPFLPQDLQLTAGNEKSQAFVRFDIGASGSCKESVGLPVERFIDLCKAYVDLSFTDQATEKQKSIAQKAMQFIMACSKIGIIALVDEATGYQYERETNALQLKLKLFLNEEMREWEKTFPDELWIEFGRLTKWTGSVHQRPKWWGKLVNELIYGYLDKDVLQWLKTNAPKPIGGQQYHQWLSTQYGLKKLNDHLWMTIGISKTCDNMKELQRIMAERFGGQWIQLSMYLKT